MRRTAADLGSLARDAGVLILGGLVCFAAAGASAASAPVRFRLSILGTTQQKWDHTDAPTTEGGCERSLRAQGTRTVAFRLSQPVMVRITDGRVAREDIRGLAGTVTLIGMNTVNQVCAGTESHTPESCAKSTATFANGRVTLQSTRPDSITLRPIRGVSLPRVDCPREPDDVVKSPLGPVPGFRLSRALVANPTIARITLTASASRRKMFGRPEAGKLRERADWTMTLTRLRP